MHGTKRHDHRETIERSEINSGGLLTQDTSDPGAGNFYRDPAPWPSLSRLRGILLPRRLASVESSIGGPPSARLEPAGLPEPVARLESAGRAEPAGWPEPAGRPDPESVREWAPDGPMAASPCSGWERPPPLSMGSKREGASRKIC